MYLLKNFEIYDRPGYFGKKRLEKETEYYEKYPLGWQECWQVGDLVYSFFEAVMLYEDAYFDILDTNVALVNWVTDFTECYDNDIRNIEDGTHYDIRANVRHLQDVAVRRVLLRLGVWFEGTDPTNLLQIRGPETNGHSLMPGKIPFHLTNLILSPPDAGPLPKWAEPNSVEGFWQRNKVIGKPQKK